MVIPRLSPQRFSEYFSLPKNINVDFLDIYAEQDIELFLDPYGIAAMQNKWAKECESQIATYFQFLIDCIRHKDFKTTKRLLNAFHEVDEVALGYSNGQPSGRGIGPLQAKEILDAFTTSDAAKSGDIKDIADCALLIPGINRDKISDITANILKGKLIEFTQQQCSKHKIPVKQVPVNTFDFEKLDFISFYTDLPVIEGYPKILLPIRAVRREPELSKDKFYRNFVLEFLRAEHSHAGDSLANILKNGQVIVRIRDLKEKYPLKTDFLYEFSKAHPRILDSFKSELKQTAIKQKPLDPLSLPKKVLNAGERLSILKGIVPGNDGASDFHKISFDNLIYIFGECLSRPNREREINEGRKRVDIVFDNNQKKGFFNSVNTLHHIRCQKIFFECKNYGKEVGNPEVDQLAGRFSPRKGEFGILLCRSLSQPELMLKRCRDLVNDQRGYILVFTDNDIHQLIEFRAQGKQDKIDLYLNEKFDQLIL